MLLFVIFVTKLVPYSITLVNAYQKGYRWLAITSMYLIGLSCFNYYNQVLDPRAQVLSTVFAFFLMMHSLNIHARRR